MNAYPIATLKPSKEIPVRAGHPWIFSHALTSNVSAPDGSIVEVQSSRGESLGLGTWNSNTNICIRMLSRDAQENIDTAYFVSRFRELRTWKLANLPAHTTGYRLVHAEADGIPGLIVDLYDTAAVFQLHTAGMDLLRDDIVQALDEALSPTLIVERSDLDVRRMEGLNTRPVTIHKGELKALPIFQEAGISFSADVLEGQKTGFFLDQRDARLAVGRLAKGRRVLNLFGYTGAFSIHAALGGAAFVTTVDISHRALEQAEEQFKLNQLDPNDESRFSFLEADVLDLLEDPNLPGGPYDLIICDPPAFAKSAAHLPKALAAYTQVNAACFSKLQTDGLLVTSSCSGRIEPEDFRSMLRIAAGKAKRDARLREWIGHPIDHAERIAFPEGRYLKTAILEVRHTY